MWLLLVLGLMIVGCVSQPEKKYWSTFHGEDEFYKWVCQYEASKKVNEWTGPTITYATQYDAQCFRTLDLKKRNP
jgi:hypothetical protein